MFKKILFPVDLSAASEKICPYVKEVAEKFNSEIHIIYILHVNHFYSNLDLSSTYLIDFENQVKKGAEKKFIEFMEDNFSGMTVQSRIMSGRPNDEIINYVRAKGLDLIIMGHSSTGIERAIFGSVAAYAVKYSPVPVMVISPDILKG